MNTPPPTGAAPFLYPSERCPHDKRQAISATANFRGQAVIICLSCGSYATGRRIEVMDDL